MNYLPTHLLREDSYTMAVDLYQELDVWLECNNLVVLRDREIGEFLRELIVEIMFSEKMGFHNMILTLGCNIKEHMQSTIHYKAWTKHSGNRLLLSFLSTFYG